MVGSPGVAPRRTSPRWAVAEGAGAGARRCAFARSSDPVHAQRHFARSSLPGQPRRRWQGRANRGRGRAVACSSAEEAVCRQGASWRLYFMYADCSGDNVRPTAWMQRKGWEKQERMCFLLKRLCGVVLNGSCDADRQPYSRCSLLSTDAAELGHGRRRTSVGSRKGRSSPVHWLLACRPGRLYASDTACGILGCVNLNPHLITPQLSTLTPQT